MQVGAGCGQVRVAQLALDQRQGDPSRNRSTPSWVWQSAASVLFRRPWVRHRSLSLSGFAGGYEPCFVGEHDRVDAVSQVEFAQDVFEVRLDRGLA